MNGQTTVPIVGFAGGCTTVLFWVLGFFAPEFFAAAPTGAEAAVTTLFVGAICYLLPSRPKERDRVPSEASVVRLPPDIDPGSDDAADGGMRQ